MLGPLLVFLFSIAFVAASPTPIIQPKACPTLVPSLLHLLNEALPASSSTIHLANAAEMPFGNFYIEHIHKGTSMMKTLQLVEFEVPPNSYGCQLHIKIPRGSMTYLNENDTTISQSPKIKVASIHPNSLPANPSYNDVYNAVPSVIKSLNFGTVTLNPSGNPNVINSEACAPAVNGQKGHMYYVFDTENEELGTYSNLAMAQSGSSAAQVSGAFLTHNC